MAVALLLGGGVGACVVDLAIGGVRMALTARVVDIDSARLDTTAGREGMLRRLDQAGRAAVDLDRRIRRSPLLLAVGIRPAAVAGSHRVADVGHATRAAVASARRLTDGVGSVAAAEIGGLADRIDAVADRLGPLPVSGTARAAAADARLVAGVLGAAAPRRYLVALQNNAEMRNQGMVLSYAELTVDGGRIGLGPHGSVMDLALDRPVEIGEPAGALAAFGPIGMNELWESVNAGADFPWSARVMAAMYHQATGRAVDGVVAIDVPALSQLLRATGPVRVEGLARPLTPATANDVLLRDIYDGVRPGEDGGRRRILAGAMQAVVEQLATGDLHRPALLDALHRASATGHLRAWSRDDAVRGALARWGVDGAVARSGPERSRTFHVAVENRTATKLDYYVTTEATIDVRTTALGTVVVRTAVDVVNRAPTGTAPSYQLGPDGFGGAATKPGDYVGWVALWVPATSVQPGSVEDAGLRLVQETVYVPAGQRARVEFETALPEAATGGRFTLRFVPQARATPPLLRLEARDVAWEGRWDRALQVEFGPPASRSGPLPMRWLLTLAAALALIALGPIAGAPARAQQYPPTASTLPPDTPVTRVDGTPVTQPGGTPVTVGPGVFAPTTTTLTKTQQRAELRRETKLPGDVIVKEVCLYKGGSTVAVAVNDVPVTQLTAGPDGCLAQTINIVDCAPPTVSIGDVRASAKLGQNTVTFTGTSARGAAATQSIPVRLACKLPDEPSDRNWTAIGLVGAGVVAMLTTGVLVEVRNRRRARTV